eukprot:480672-Amphidinium_carterae.2
MTEKDMQGLRKRTYRSLSTLRSSATSSYYRPIITSSLNYDRDNIKDYVEAFALKHNGNKDENKDVQVWRQSQP